MPTFSITVSSLDVSADSAYRMSIEFDADVSDVLNEIDPYDIIDHLHGTVALQSYVDDHAIAAVDISDFISYHGEDAILQEIGIEGIKHFFKKSIGE
ncbi:MAG: hypothetical protein BV459_00200 [Thermoplasmata archaeon M11B2D]|nr:MAG: hypothetical protein BV459_00200 [Thermoplasmata archaeon M11B2D]